MLDVGVLPGDKEPISTETLSWERWKIYNRTGLLESQILEPKLLEGSDNRLDLRITTEVDYLND